MHNNYIPTILTDKFRVQIATRAETGIKAGTDWGRTGSFPIPLLVQKTDNEAAFSPRNTNLSRSFSSVIFKDLMQLLIIDALFCSICRIFSTSGSENANMFI